MTADRAGVSKGGSEKEAQVSPTSRNVYYDFSSQCKSALTYQTSWLLRMQGFTFPPANFLMLVLISLPSLAAWIYLFKVQD